MGNSSNRCSNFLFVSLCVFVSLFLCVRKAEGVCFCASASHALCVAGVGGCCFVLVKSRFSPAAAIRSRFCPALGADNRFHMYLYPTMECT